MSVINASRCWIILVLILLISFQNRMVSIKVWDQCSNFTAYCCLINRAQVQCDGFSNFTEILQKYNATSSYLDPNVRMFSFNPIRTIRFAEDSLYSIHNFYQSFKFAEQFHFDRSRLGEIQIFDVEGFDLILMKDILSDNFAHSLYGAPSDDLAWTTTTVTFNLVHLSFVNYGLNFYYYGGLAWPNSSYYCNDSWLSYLYNEYNQYDNILNLFPNLIFKRLKYSSSRNICPFIFMKSAIDSLKFVGNPWLEFDTAQYDQLDQLESWIYDLELSRMYKIDLTTQVLHWAVYKEIIYFSITESSINSIDKNVFSYFYKLTNIYIQINNLKYFLHKNKIEWIKGINYNVEVDLSDILSTADNVNETLVLIQFQNLLNQSDYYPASFFPYLVYDFPDQDFCLFSDYPHNQLVVSAALGNHHCEQTCTLAYIYFYLPLYIFDVQVTKVINLFENKIDLCTAAWQELTANNSCNFIKMTAKCRFNSTTRPIYQYSYFQLYDIKSILITCSTTVLSYIAPVLSALSVLTNILIIVVCFYSHFNLTKIKNLKNLGIIDLKEPVNKFIVLNAILNTVFSLIYLLDYLVPCESLSTLKAVDSAVQSNCYIKDMAIVIMTSVLKFQSNVCLILLSAHRCFLVDTSDKTLVAKLANIRVSRIMIWSTLLGSLFIPLVYFEQVVFSNQYFQNSGSMFASSSNIIYYNYYMWDYEEFGLTVRQFVIDKVKQTPWIVSFTILHELLNYLIFCGLIAYIDIKTRAKFVRVLNEKKKLSSIDHSNEMSIAYKKMTVMVILNSLINIVLRLPELASLILLSIISMSSQGPYLFKNLCFSYRQCLNLVNMENVFYLMSISMPVFFYLIFNNAFRLSLVKSIKIFKK